MKKSVVPALVLATPAVRDVRLPASLVAFEDELARVSGGARGTITYVVVDGRRYPNDEIGD